MLHLTGAAPFAAPLDGDNTVGVYFDMDDVFGTQKFRGGFYTDDGSADFLASIQGASFEYFIRTAGVTPYELNGVYYQPLAEYDPRLGFNVATVAEIADFADGNIAGRVMLLHAVVPEPATLLIWSLLAGLGVGLGWRRRRK